MTSIFDSLREERLQWLPELGFGHYPVTAQPYDSSYWDNYRKLDNTRMGVALTKGRRELVDLYWDGEVVDIGIGGGLFVSSRPKTYGFDINPSAVDWLRTEKKFIDPYKAPVDAVTFWDSLEHIHEIGGLLFNVKKYVFVSLPIFTDVSHVLRSKHYKKDEHCWYFTAQGIQNYMKLFGFGLLYYDNREETAGREDILSFVFRRL